MTPAQIKFTRGMLAKMGATDMKDDFAQTYSSGRTTHLSELNYAESKELIDYLKKETGVPDSPANKMRGKMLSMAHDMGWETEGGKVDMARLNGWCTRYGHGHKPLKDYTEEELPTLVTQFENVFRAQMKK